MGYTHYWRTATSGIPATRWDRICQDVRRLFRNLPEGVKIAWEDDQPKKCPEVSKDLIRFNGVNGEGYETFYIERMGEKFAFCKTARQPYDIVVCGVLIVVARHASSAVEVIS